jgi:hypothetical protein
MSLPTQCQPTLDALNEIGTRLKQAKTAGTDVTSLLEEFNATRNLLESIVRPLAEEEYEKDSLFYWDVLAPIFVRVMSKSEKKKYEKAVKKRKKASANATAAAAPGAPVPAPVPAPTTTKGPSKKQLKYELKQQKKAAAKEAKALLAATTATTKQFNANKSKARRLAPTQNVSTASTASTASTSSSSSSLEKRNLTALTEETSSFYRPPTPGLIDPARCSTAALRQILTVANMSGHKVALGRYQTNTLFQDVPSYDVGNGKYAFLFSFLFFLFFLFFYKRELL